ncbi:MAG: TonB-dependent receptor [Sphingobacteriaceae bacterium]
MKRNFTQLLGAFLFWLITINSAWAQVNLSGIITDGKTKEPLPGVSISVKGGASGTTTDEKGRFKLSVQQSAQFTLIISYIGFTSMETEVSASNSNLNFEMQATSILGMEVVVAASRTPENILQSPVSIERLGPTAIRETAAPSFYESIANLKGVEMSAQSLTFRSINTRGFNSNGNVRFNQYIDGMDNQAPGLNFSIGNVVGVSDLDAESVELLPGASSALYGAGGTNGTLLINSKNPFTYPGVSMMFKGGVNHVDDSGQGVQGFKDFSIRIAKSWNNKFAFKTNVSYLEAQDWAATDQTNFNRKTNEIRTGDRNSHPDYDGVNVYGDEPNTQYPALNTVANAVQARTRAGILAATANTLDIVQALDASLPANANAAQIGAFLGNLPAALRPSIQGMIPFYFGLRNDLIPAQTVTRTGYQEKDLVDYNAKSLKTSSSLHYKLSNTIEAIAQANWGGGTSVYTGSDRYSLRNFNIGQYKLELKGSDFFLRAYTTQERSGKAYNATALGTYLNEYSSPSGPTAAGPGWFVEYAGVYAGSKLQGANEETANFAARQYADRNRPVPGTPKFDSLKNIITSRTIGPAGGARFNDKTNLYQYEGNYNFTNVLKSVVEFQIGASYRRYALHSDGTIFDDLNKNLTIDEYGAYAQLAKKLFNEKLKLTAAVRYDKNENFEGRFTPRISGVYEVARNNNIRVSYQTGFRNPTAQDQYIDLLVGGSSGTRLIGGLPSLIEKYDLYNNKGYTLKSFNQFSQSGNIADLKQFTFNKFRPESVNAYEIGYKGLLGDKLLVDTYYYYNIYQNFISNVILLQTPDGTPATLGQASTFSTFVNNSDKVKSNGAAFGLDYLMGQFNLSGNASYNDLENSSSILNAQFNTPKYRFNLGIGNREVFKNVGFSAAYRWQDKFVWSSTFATGEVPAYGSLDAQISFKLPVITSTIKFGGSNVLNKYYRTSFGNPSIGAIYYVSYTFDQFLR